MPFFWLKLLYFQILLFELILESIDYNILFSQSFLQVGKLNKDVDMLEVSTGVFESKEVVQTLLFHFRLKETICHWQFCPQLLRYDGLHMESLLELFYSHFKSIPFTFLLCSDLFRLMRVWRYNDQRCFLIFFGLNRVVRFWGTFWMAFSFRIDFLI